MPVGRVQVPKPLLPIFKKKDPNEILNLPSLAYKQWYDSIKDSLQCGERFSLGVLRRKITKRQYAFKQSRAIKCEMHDLKITNAKLQEENASLRAEIARLNARASGLSPTRMDIWRPRWKCRRTWEHVLIIPDTILLPVLELYCYDLGSKWHYETRSRSRWVGSVILRHFGSFVRFNFKFPRLVVHLWVII